MKSNYPYELPPLPFAYDALEPVISKLTLEFHHDKHFLAYINNQELNILTQTFIFVFGLFIPIIYTLIRYFDINISETYYLIIGDINFYLKK